MTASSSAPFLSPYLGAYLSDHSITLLQLTIASFLFWNVFNIVAFNLPLPDQKLSREDYLDLRNRITSFVHGFLIMVLSFYNTFFVQSACGEANTQFEEQLLIISNGYFFYDLFAMIYLGICDRSMFIHHFICLSGVNFGLFTRYAGNVLLSSTFVAEVSNPPMHFRVILKHLGLRYTLAYSACLCCTGHGYARRTTLW
ncbi:hypothetical protein FGO68_gene3054 [Halteria grandinella]|uniref:TLC domain-containing protein n=1 Tax=Halteria grandinella TaxID=5974 RepID=A0A8J8T0F1_HALGN|nr:hypothetical protein FGO68_gene3054 [Halteria grandinella]